MMLSSILTAAGLRAPAVGNIGDSLVSAVMDPIPADVLLLKWVLHNYLLLDQCLRILQWY